jgi:hypothetical protein
MAQQRRYPITLDERLLATLLRQPIYDQRMAGKGQEEPFPLPMPNGRYRFRKRSLCCQRTGHVGFWVRFLAVKYS